MSTTIMDLAAAQEGMVLGADATSPKGQLLLAAGTRLTDRHLRLLAANGVAEVAIGNHRQEDNASVQLSAEQLEAHLQERFEHNDDNHPLIRELKRICRSRLDGGTNEGGETYGH